MGNIIKKTICFISISILMASCALDNYDRPPSALSGAIIDRETGDLIEQDIIRGTQIEYEEGRFLAKQYLVVKSDGTYQNNQVFNGIYRIAPVRGNFEPIDMDVVEISGDTRKDFKVIPFLRIKNVSVFKNGNKVRALFKIQQTGYDNVLKVGLYAGIDQAVGANVNATAIEIPIGSRVTDNQSISVEMNLEGNSKLQKGNTYFFRVGAVIDAPEAKFNYAPAIKLSL